MEPINFKGANRELRKPDSMTDEECSSLHVFNNGRESISCWTLSWRERIALLFRGRIWLTVLGGFTQPPVWLSADKEVALNVQTCRECGCTEDNACVTERGPCHWAAPDLCSACRDRLEAALHNCATCGKSVRLTQEIDGYECEHDGEIKFAPYVDMGEYDDCLNWVPGES